MAWYKLVVTADQAARGEHSKLLDLLTQVFLQLGAPCDIAVFSSGWHPSKTFTFYFTPGCACHPATKAIMDSFGAGACDEPTRDTERELGLDLGESGRWASHTWSVRDSRNSPERKASIDEES